MQTWESTLNKAKSLELKQERATASTTEMEIATTSRGWAKWRFGCFSSLASDRTSGTGDSCNEAETVRRCRGRRMKRHQSRSRLKLKIRLLRPNTSKAMDRKRLQDCL